jgi:hypothetical protein
MGKRLNNARAHISKNRGRYGLGIFVFIVVLCLILWAAGVFSSSDKKTTPKTEIKPAATAATVATPFKITDKLSTNFDDDGGGSSLSVSYTHLRAHET